MPKKINSKQVTKDFRKTLAAATDEKDVEHAYWNFLQAYYPNVIISSKYNTDGYVQTMFFKLLLEVKYDKTFLDKKNQCSVLVQALYYIKAFDENGDEKPNVILIGDKNECFVIHGNHIYPYLEENIDWGIAPSEAALKNPKLVVKLEQDRNISPFIFSIDENFNCDDLKDLIEQYAFSEQREGVRVTEKNIARIYDDFIRTVIRRENLHNYTPNELVSIFILTMTNPNGDTYIVPNKMNTLHLSNGKIIQVDGKAFDAFFCQFNRNYTPQEIDVFNSIADRLLQETERRFQGSFWTPNIWVDKAHEMFSEVIGQDWKERCVVWDASCGSMNLTRDYKFKDLYCSTLMQEELDIGIQYNPEATKFRYDFLNGIDIDLLDNDAELVSYPADKVSRLPSKLVDALKSGKPVVFFNNPPYAQAGDKMGSTGGDKKDVAKTFVNQLMIRDGCGKAAQQLYAQFLYRIKRIVDKYQIREAYIGLYSPSLFLTGNSYKDFRKLFFSRFEYVDGCMFQASNFADVQDSWAISFTVFKITSQPVAPTEFEVSVLDIDEQTNDITCLARKSLYNLDESVEAASWVRAKIKHIKTQTDYIQLQSALKYERLTGIGSYAPGSIGYFLNDSNNIYANSKYVGIFSAPHAHGHGLNVFPENYEETISLFSARTLIASSWINQKDEYMMPDINHPLYNEWLADCMVYSLFSPKSNQSALRNALYKGQSYNIKNEWFWVSARQMKDWANKYHYNELYMDAKTESDSYVYRRLSQTTLSSEAQAVLDKATEIVEMLIQNEFRQQVALAHPEYHLNAWDAGWYQMKKVLKEYSLPELSEMDDLVHILEEKMRPMVYELGFLKQ